MQQDHDLQQPIYRTACKSGNFEKITFSFREKLSRTYQVANDFLASFQSDLLAIVFDHCGLRGKTWQRYGTSESRSFHEAAYSQFIPFRHNWDGEKERTIARGAHQPQECPP